MKMYPYKFQTIDEDNEVVAELEGIDDYIEIEFKRKLYIEEAEAVLELAKKALVLYNNEYNSEIKEEI